MLTGLLQRIRLAYLGIVCRLPPNLESREKKLKKKIKNGIISNQLLLHKGKKKKSHAFWFTAARPWVTSVGRPKFRISREKKRIFS